MSTQARTIGAAGGILLVGCLASGLWFYHSQADQARAKTEVDLAAIAQFKCRQIATWREERLADAAVMMENLALQQAMVAYLRTADPQAMALLVSHIDSYARHFGYDDAKIVGADGIVRWLRSGPPKPMHDASRVALKEALAGHRVTFDELHSSYGQIPHMGVVAPYFHPDTGQPLGAIILLIHADKFLYPQIQAWPLPSDSGEVLLVRRAGNEVLFLNDLRFRPDAALKLKFPLNTATLPAAMAARGETGIVRGQDYRGVAVLAAINRIAGSDWYLVAKVDDAEAQAPWNREMRLIVMLLVAIICSAGLLLTLHWRHQLRASFRRLAKAQEALAMTRFSIDQLADTVFWLATDGTVADANTGAVKALGYTRDELLKLKIFDIDPALSPEQWEWSWQTAHDNRPPHRETSYLRQDGSSFPVEVLTTFMESGGAPYCCVLAHDISDHKEAMQTLQESEARWRLTLDLAPFPIIVYTQDGQVLTINRAWESFTGYSLADIPTMADWIRVAHDGEDPGYLADKHQHQEQQSTSQEGEFTIRTASGDERIWECASAPLGQQEDGRRVVISMAHDITERKAREAELEELNDDLDTSNKELEQFAYIASHDLQEPLRMVSSYTQLLGERYGDSLDEKARKWIHFAVDGATRMQCLIQDLLSYSRVTTRGSVPTRIDSHFCLGSALSRLQSAVRESHALITNDDLPYVTADSAQLVQLFQNLLSNAIKFHGPQDPRVHVSARQCGDFWQFSIRDNGIGIEPEYAERVFLIFKRLHTMAEYPGTGIGLAVCQRIVNRHNGRIWFDSEPGVGSTFHFTLPG